MTRFLGASKPHHLDATMTRTRGGIWDHVYIGFYEPHGSE